MKAVSVIGIFTLLSRLLGFLRDIVIARGFGAGAGADAFFIALKLPNFLRRLFAEGAFNTAFVPVFNDVITRGKRGETERTIQIVFTLLFCVLIVVVVVAQILMPVLITLIAPGFLEDPEKHQLTVTLTRITFPYIFFISLVSLAGGILNSLHRFAVPAFTPTLLNVALIFGALILAPYFDQPTIGLAIGVFLGGLLQLVLQMIALARIGFFFRFRWDPRHPVIQRILKLMGPSILGVSVAQINLLFDIFIASWLSVGSISYLYYADRLVEFPLGIFGIALSTAILPAFSAKASLGEFNALKNDLTFALRLTIVITLPAATGLILLREPILVLLFERGAFDAHVTAMTAQALLAYAVGLPAFSGIKIVAPAFYALQDTRTPVRIAIVALVANMVLNVLLVFPLQHVGLALATSLAAFLNLGLLLMHLSKKSAFTSYLTHIREEIITTLVKTAAATLTMAVSLIVIQRLFIQKFFLQQSLSTLLEAILLLSVILAGIGVFLISGRFLKIETLRDLAAMVSRSPRSTASTKSSEEKKRASP